MLLEGQLFDQYRIICQLKSGGMGEVYLADDTRLHRQVAIKVIHIEASRYSYNRAAQEAARLFLREAQVIAHLDHLHILPLYGSGEKFINGTRLMYMVMPFRQEGSLVEWLYKHEESVLSVWVVERIIGQAASALQHAHNQKIIHQDVKPSNFLIQGNAEQANQLILQLADFGVAKFMSRTSESQIIRGTPDYMAPEQWEGHPVPATDQYALAVMAYELLTGYLPFTGSNHQQIWHQHRFVEPEPPSSINPNIPEEIDDVLLRALSKSPADRFGTIEIFARAFRQAFLHSGDIHQTLTISLWEARKGIRRVIILPGRKQVTVDVPAGIQNGQAIRLEGWGRPSGNGGPVGALIITINISEVPDIATLTYTTKVDKTAPAHNGESQSGNRANVILKFALPLLFIALSFSVILITWIHQQNAPKITTSIATNDTHTATTSTVPATVNTTASAQANETGTTQAGSTSTAQTLNNSATATANAQITANATATANANATATANANATATAQIISANATATAYVTATHLSHLTLSDPLQDNSRGYNWNTSPIPGGGGCAFTGGTYYSSMPQTNSFAPCFAQSTNFSDFAYEVQMTIIKGDQGGIVFRADAQNGMFYYFHINRNGMYALETISHFNSTGIIANGSSSAIKTGLNQTNLLAVVAKGSTIELFVNRQMIASVSDTTYTQGQIGVIAENTGADTAVAFSNAKVWTQ